jgi:tetratricopeptide (TPR) repeat protein
MFELFNNKRPKLTITEEDKKWVEENLLWLGETYGFERVLKTPFIYPHYEEFPYNNLRKEEQFIPFFKKLCDIFGVNPKDIIVLTFSNDTTQWNEIIPNNNSVAKTNIKSRKITKYRLLIADDDFETVERTVAVVVYNLALFKLVKDGYHKRDADKEDDSLVVLTALFFGFGVFFANGNFLQKGRKKSIITTFPEQAIAYINALICYITGTEFEKVNKLLNKNTKHAFKQNYEYLKKTGDTVLDKATLDENIKLNKLYDLIDKLDAENALIIAWDEVLKIRNEEWEPWNNLGYAKLMLGRFEEAIKDFTKAIYCDNCAPYPFNNRGFCRLQIGDLIGGYSDIISSLNFDDSNSYVWRTLGIYYLLMREYTDALENLEQALSMDESTDLIHFYLAKAYAAVGNTNKQQYHQQKSIELNETTDEFLKANRI